MGAGSRAGTHLRVPWPRAGLAGEAAESSREAGRSASRPWTRPHDHAVTPQGEGAVRIPQFGLPRVSARASGEDPSRRPSCCTGQALAAGRAGGCSSRGRRRERTATKEEPRSCGSLRSARTPRCTGADSCLFRPHPHCGAGGPGPAASGCRLPPSSPRQACCPALHARESLH